MGEGISVVEVLVMVDVDVLLNRHSLDVVRRRDVRERNTESMTRETRWWTSNSSASRKLGARHGVTALQKRALVLLFTRW